MTNIKDYGQDMTRSMPIVPAEVTHDDIEREFPNYAALDAQEEREATLEEMSKAKSLAESLGWSHQTSRFTGNPHFSHSVHGVVMADNWIDLCEMYGISECQEEREAANMEIEEKELFNCCANGTAPDWILYSSLEMGACMDEAGEGDDGTHIVSCSLANAEFVTIYGILKTGEHDPITDITDSRLALRIACEIMARSRLPLSLSPRMAETEN